MPHKEKTTRESIIQANRLIDRLLADYYRLQDLHRANRVRMNQQYHRACKLRDKYPPLDLWDQVIDRLHDLP